ncbi:MAG: Asp-tRNA(Asn)/Glu-tRNA(Gln) amidotransferase subunit GatB [Spirochaetaceae bacterium]|jgi:aspartyl-tRNA(Asn)/glutamyl-tRNA(Gln) amidotransferase subunit B|nr:Asp-tRNA(Asn)/Glu-tRNA(Gln) amidotransferase subunit GatB [Spirochaetaceae bacterium]
MYQTFIGLEVHIHLLTKTKVFCDCRAAFGDAPNTNVCPVCLGFPGVMPRLNVEAVRMGCMVARALECTVPPLTWFERKQYFYPDMTKNYQISQFASPLGRDGFLTISCGGALKKVRIHECHLEEDAGKMIHTGTSSLLDYNRAGVSLLEIVTEPDMASGEEAEQFIQELRRTVRYLGVCDGNMEEGSLRADANISINLPGKGLGRKVEIKNLNSSRFVRLGLNYEAARQAAILDGGGAVVQETRLWNENRDQTETMRVKENAHDYRYFPEPDLPPLRLDAGFLSPVEAALVELPLARQRRFVADFALPEAAAQSLCDEGALADFFEAALSCACAAGIETKAAAGVVCGRILTEVRHLLAREHIAPKDIGSAKLRPEFLAELVVLLDAGRVSQKNAKQVLDISFMEGKAPEWIVEEKGWEQISDAAVIAGFADSVCAAEAASFEQARAASAAGDGKRLGVLSNFLLGKVIALSGGKANPSVAGAEIARRIAEASAMA